MAIIWWNFTELQENYWCFLLPALRWFDSFVSCSLGFGILDRIFSRHLLNWYLFAVINYYDFNSSYLKAILDKNMLIFIRQMSCKTVFTLSCHETRLNGDNNRYLPKSLVRHLMVFWGDVICRKIGIAQPLAVLLLWFLTVTCSWYYVSDIFCEF